MSAHIEVDRLLAYAHDELAGAEAAAVLEHCESCPECGNQLGVLLALRHEQQRSEAEPSLAPVVAARPLPRFMKLAASMVLAVVLGAAGLWSAGVFDTDPQLPEWTALATDQPPDQTLVDWLFEEAQQTLTAAPANPDADPAAAHRQLVADKRAALELIVEGRYAVAIAAFEDLAADHPDDDEIAAFYGVAAYLAGDTGEPTATLLRRGAQSRRQPVGRTAAWYLANYHLRAGELEEARVVLDSLAQMRDLAGTNAAALLERLPADVRR